MTAPERQRLEALFRVTANTQEVPEEGHIKDDEELLTCWSLGTLTPGQQAAIVEHLADCPPCRQGVAEMLRAGVLAPLGAEPALRARRRVRPLWVLGGLAGLAAAACLAFLLLRPAPDGPTANELAAADLAAGRPREALERLERLGPRTSNEEVRRTALLRQAAYELAR
jgi:hypothetical protein